MKWASDTPTLFTSDAMGKSSDLLRMEGVLVGLGPSGQGHGLCFILMAFACLVSKTGRTKGRLLLITRRLASRRVFPIVSLVSSAVSQGSARCNVT